MGNSLNEAIGDQLQPTRRKILLALKQHGGLTAAELARMLGITSMGIRRHLTTLERDKLVVYELVQRGKGRPSYVYQLSRQAENLFPKNYSALANELLSYLAQGQGEDTVIHLFDQRAQRRIRNALEQLANKSLVERVAALSTILNNEGYLAEWEQVDEDTFWLREHNCAVHDVAAEFSAACNSELTFLQAVLPDTQITREHHIMSGEPTCAYRILRRKEDASDG
jgi:DeoR family transcriptional regulator, suf operon transcriptional repressor